MNTDIFDSLFKQALGMHRYAAHVQRYTASAFPPYNVIVDNIENPTNYTIELAVAGFAKEHLNVKLRKDTGIPVLVIEGQKSDEKTEGIYIDRGLAARSFSREFTLSNDMEVNDILLRDGILTIYLNSFKPPEKETVLLIK